jgi:tetratricopeptide (TPR) repeat protein
MMKPAVIRTGKITMWRLGTVIVLAACASTPAAEPEVHAVVIEPTPAPPEDERHELEELQGLPPIIEEAAAEEAEPEEPQHLVPVLPPPAYASAQPAVPPPPAPPPAAVAAARQAFQEGIAAYQGADYAAALRHFERAHALAPLPKLFHNMAMAALEAGDKAKACRYYAEGTKQGNPAIPKLDQECHP